MVRKYRKEHTFANYQTLRSRRNWLVYMENLVCTENQVTSTNFSVSSFHKLYGWDIRLWIILLPLTIGNCYNYLHKLEVHIRDYSIRMIPVWFDLGSFCIGIALMMFLLQKPEKYLIYNVHLTNRTKFHWIHNIALELIHTVYLHTNMFYGNEHVSSWKYIFKLQLLFTEANFFSNKKSNAFHVYTFLFMTVYFHNWIDLSKLVVTVFVQTKAFLLASGK